MTGSPRAEPRSESSEPGSRAFIWGVWGVMTLATAMYVAWFGSNIPILDDYNIVDALVGYRKVTVGWLWEQTNEHRLVVPKVILLAAHRLAGNDVRAGMFLSVATLSVLTAVLIRLSARLPGGLRPCDAVFPLLVLGLGPGANLVWSIHFANVLPTAIATGLLVPIIARTSWPAPGIALWVGFCMVILPLCGGTGLVFVPALALWLLGAAVAEVRSRGHRRAALLVLAAVPGITLTALYFRGFQKALHPEPESPLVSGVRAAWQFLTCGLGMPTAQVWPWSGIALAFLVAMAVGVLADAWVRRPSERPRVFGLVCFLAGVGALAAAVGWGRGWAGELAGFQYRYVTMAAPLWCWLVFTIRLYAPPALGTVVRNSLLVLVCALTWPKTEGALERGQERASRDRDLVRDLRSGMPAFRLVKGYTPYLHPNQDEVARMLPLLRSAGIGPFRFLRDNPPFTAVPLDVAPSALSLAHWDGRTVHVTGVDPQVTFTLAQPRPVAGIRIRYSHRNRQGAPARFQMTWKRPGAMHYSEQDRYANWFLPTGEGKDTTIWVDDVIAQFRIQPDNQLCEFRIDGIVLLVP